MENKKYGVIKLHVETQKETVVKRDLTFDEADELAEGYRVTNADREVTYYMASLK